MHTDVAPSPAPTGPLASPAPRKAGAGLKIALIAAGAVAAIVVVTGLLSRSHEAAGVKTWTAAQAVPTVTIVHPAAASGVQDLVLPGALQAWYNAQIFPRVSGYVHAWYDDIGARVKTGQVLATIDTPELDQQLVQARADLASAQAYMQLASTTAKRWSKLLTQDAVSRQESEEKAGDLQVKTALVNAAEANLNRLLALKAFARIVAPFDGVVTARKTDIGALVNAGAGANSTSELFDVAEVDRLRLYVHVPQADSARIKPGMTAALTVPEYPGKTFTAKLLSTSNAVSEASGALLVELEVPNAGGELQAGDYAQTTFNLPNAGAQGSGLLTLPSSALLFLKTGLEGRGGGAGKSGASATRHGRPRHGLDHADRRRPHALGPGDRQPARLHHRRRTGEDRQSGRQPCGELGANLAEGHLPHLRWGSTPEWAGGGRAA